MPENKEQIKKIVAKLVGVLNPRNRDILSRRFGIKTGDKETLEAIGKGYGITRERVRQIQDASLASVRQSDGFANVAAPYVRLARNIINETGGVLRETDLFSAFSGTAKSNPANAALTLILTLDNSMKRTPEDDSNHAYWSTAPEAKQNYKNAVASLAGAFKQRKNVVANGELAGFVSQEAGLASMDADTLNSYLAISKKVSTNVFGEVGLTKWAAVKPRGVRDKAYLVLQREGKPKHFREIAQLINASFPDKKAHVQTVHNEAIKDDRFCLVGRGMYALTEWGYKEGTVKDVIADLVRANGPMHKDDIVAKVLDVRMVKPNTVILGMQDKKVFKEHDDGKIGLHVQEA